MERLQALLRSLEEGGYGVPVIPGYDDVDRSLHVLQKEHRPGDVEGVARLREPEPLHEGGPRSLGPGKPVLVSDAIECCPVIAVEAQGQWCLSVIPVLDLAEAGGVFAGAVSPIDEADAS
jgi:hypothetical protein